MLNEQFSRMALYSHIDQPDLSWRTGGTEEELFVWRPACAKPLRRRQVRERQTKKRPLPFKTEQTFHRGKENMSFPHLFGILGSS
jgi:hypothetical protein